MLYPICKFVGMGKGINVVCGLMWCVAATQPVPACDNNYCAEKHVSRM